MPDHPRLYRIPTGSDTFANPWIACDHCRAQVTHVDGPPVTNQPCGHRADANTLCPSWGPVDGCTCAARGISHEAPREVTR